MTQYGFYFDNSRCTGCRTCEMACKDFKNLDQTHAFRKVFDYEGGSTTADGGVVTTDVYAYHVSTACNHCEAPACMAVCPSGAIEKDEANGIVTIDQEKCSGAKLCLDACPYSVPVWFEDLGKANKCDLCKERTTAGLNPICVDACPLRALEFGDIEELRAAHPDAVDSIAPLPSANVTGPSVCILMSPAAKAWDDKTGAITNEKEVTGEPARAIV